MPSGRGDLVLIGSPTLTFLEPRFARHYTVGRLWEANAAELARARVLVAGGPVPVPAATIDALPQLGLIACLTAGYEGVDIAYAARRGVAVSHSPGASTRDVADFALALLLAAVRKVHEGDRLLRASAWRDGPPLFSRSLAGLKIGIVGLGRIGSAIAARCQALGMRVSWWGPSAKPDAPWPRRARLLDLARGSDALILAARAENGAPPLIRARELEALGPGGVLVNVARGALVDEGALIEALRTGKVGGAALDVFDPEPTNSERWFGIPNIILTPHIAGATPATVEAMVKLTTRNIDLFLAGRKLRTPVSD
jgi:lactate dehydrogenase-like 2-hydroxyacid dehydrogenase